MQGSHDTGVVPLEPVKILSRIFCPGDKNLDSPDAEIFEGFGGNFHAAGVTGADYQYRRRVEKNVRQILRGQTVPLLAPPG